MFKDLKNVAYIDNTNLHKGTEAEGFIIDYKKFRIYLKEKLAVKTAYIFIGYVPGNEERYRKFYSRKENMLPHFINLSVRLIMQIYQNRVLD